jgi:hypothetical protein
MLLELDAEEREELFRLPDVRLSLAPSLARARA